MRYLFFIIAALNLAACGPSGLEMQSIEKSGGVGSLWGDRTGEGQLDAFGFNLEEKYETEYLIGAEDGFTDMVYINIYCLIVNWVSNLYIFKC